MPALLDLRTDKISSAPFKRRPNSSHQKERNGKYLCSFKGKESLWGIRTRSKRITEEPHTSRRYFISISFILELWTMVGISFSGKFWQSRKMYPRQKLQDSPKIRLCPCINRFRWPQTHISINSTYAQIYEDGYDSPRLSGPTFSGYVNDHDCKKPQKHLS